MRRRFWERYDLRQLTATEWEALCDGCGLCCLQKLEDADTGDILYTRVSCRLLDTDTCRCGNYPLRKTLVPDCVMLSPETLPNAATWLPETCAYKRLYQGQTLPSWHPLICGDPDRLHRAGISVKGRVIPEYEVNEDDWESLPLIWGG